MKITQQIIRKGFAWAFVIASISCSSTKTNTGRLAAADCPEDGKCAVVIHANKGMMVKKEESGRLYYELEDNPAKNVVVYTYDRTPLKDVKDGSYREEVIVELDKGQQSIVLSNGLSKSGTKALFGRFCYCKGSTGYYRIGDGNLNVSPDDKDRYSMDFKITEVPQVLQKIQFSIK